MIDKTPRRRYGFVGDNDDEDEDKLTSSVRRGGAAIGLLSLARG
jgi:hypothetical protein